MDAALGNFAAALEQSVTEIDRAVRSRQHVPQSMATLEHLQVLKDKMEDVEDALEHCERKHAGSGLSLNELVRLASHKVRTTRALVNATARAVGHDFKDSSFETPQESPTAPYASSSPSHAPNSPKLSIDSSSRYQNDSSHAMTPPRHSSNKFSTSDVASIGSDPPTPTLEDFGLSRASYLNNDDSEDESPMRSSSELGSTSRFETRGSENCAEEGTFGQVEDCDDIETIELSFVTKDELEQLPFYLKAQVDVDSLNEVYQRVSEVACANGGSLEFTLEQVETGRRAGSCKAGVLCLNELKRLTVISTGVYRLLPCP
mmetsp:Transcript_10113/g.17803  ORF Transcript_10113/g.17803 Transcript_10113/m.17803 type:complete len:317 (-) Transcript_10113:183-1133(-)